MVLKIHLCMRNNLSNSGYSREEEGAIYDTQLDDIIQNTKWYLQALDYLYEYRVSFKNYRSGKKKNLLNGKKSIGTPTLPLKYIN